MLHKISNNNHLQYKTKQKYNKTKQQQKKEQNNEYF